MVSKAPALIAQPQEVYGDIPLPRFGHSITMVSKTKVVLFGGATGDTGRYSMTGDTFIFNALPRTWVKLQGRAIRLTQPAASRPPPVPPTPLPTSIPYKWWSTAVRLVVSISC